MLKSKILLATFCLAVFAAEVCAQEQILSLEQCKQMALEHNLGLRVAHEQVGATDALSKSARTNFSPTFQQMQRTQGLTSLSAFSMATS